MPADIEELCQTPEGLCCEDTKEAILDSSGGGCFMKGTSCLLLQHQLPLLQQPHQLFQALIDGLR